MRTGTPHDHAGDTATRRERETRPAATEEPAEADGLLDIADVRMLLREIRLRDARRRSPGSAERRRG